MKQVSLPTVDATAQTGSARFRQWIQMLIADGAVAWNLPPRLVIAICLAPFVVAAAGVVSALLGKEAYKWFTQEDGFAETMQVIFYLLTLILGLIVTRRQWQSEHKVIAFLYTGLCFALFFLIGEELSWGQRLFGWQTAESLVEINKQNETNLHNIYGVGATFKWIQLLVGAYGTLLPLAFLRWKGPARLQRFIPLLVPHYTLIPCFAMLFVWRIYRNVVPDFEQFYFVIAEYNEVMELALAMGLFLFMVFQLRRSQHGYDDELDALEE